MKRMVVVLALACAAASTSAGFSTFDVPGAGNTYLNGVNDAGHMVGTVNYGSSDSFGLLLQPDLSYVTFDVPGAGATTWALDINNAGDIVGSFSANGRQSGFLRTANGDYVRIDYPGASSTEARGINDRGDVIGVFRLPGASDRGFFRDATGALTPFDVPGGTSSAWGINDDGVIVGEANVLPDRAFYGTLLGGFTRFSVSGDPDTTAYGINDLGDIVGYTAQMGEAGFLLRGSGDTLSYRCAGHTRFHDISNDGLIVGECWSGGPVHGLIGRFEPSSSSSAPEPGTLALLGLSLTGLVATRSRKSASARS